MFNCLKFVFFAIIIPDLIKGRLTVNPDNAVTKALHRVVSDLFFDYLSDFNCLVWIQEKGSEYEWDPSGLSACVVTATEDSIKKALVQTFKFGCQGYIVQMEDPIKFLKLWDDVRSDELSRHTPRMVFLPWNSSTFADQLFNTSVVDYIPDMLAVQTLTTGPTVDDVIFEMATNNFFVPFSDDNRDPSIILGVWPINVDIDWFPDKTANLQGKIIRMATLQYPPYSQVTPEFDGMEIRLIKTFCELSNCTVVPVIDDDLWGEIWDNKSGNGVLGNVYTGNADFGAGAVYVWYNEYKFLGFSFPYLESRVTVLVPRPSQLPEWSIPVIAFSPAMWAVQLVSIVVTAALLYVVNRNADKISPRDMKRRGEFATLSGIIMRSFGMALLQAPAGRFASGSILQRFFTLFEVLFLMFTTIYSGALSSVLTVPVYYPPIDSPLALYESGITWMADHDAWIYSLQQATEPHLQGLVKKFQAHETRDLIRYAKMGGYGFSIEIMAAGHVTHTAHLSGEMILGLHVMKKELYSTPSVTIFRKGSPFTERFDWLVHRCLDAGLFLLWEGDSTVKYLSSRLQTALKLSESSGHELHHPLKLRINHVQGAFILLAFGTIAASVLFIIELSHSKQVIT